MKINLTKKYCILFLIFSSSLNAGVLSGPELYVRCYSHMTGQRPSRTDPLLLQVKANTKSYTNACMELFSKAKLDSNGVVTAKVNASPDPVAQRILQTFNSFHNTWFTNLDYGSNINCGQYDILDNQEMSYHVSNALFNNGAYSNVITSNQTYAAIRVSPNNVDNGGSRACPDYTMALKTWKFISSTGVSTTNTLQRATKWKPYLPEVGTLVGIKPMPNEDFVPYITSSKRYLLPDPYENYDQSSLYSTTKSEDNDYRTGFSSTLINSPTSIKLHASYGSGVIGTVPFLVLNNGRDQSYKADGLITLPRRWSKNVIRDVLCRELPVLRNSDVTSSVVSNSQASFRSAASCLRCHNTMDPMAYGIRNLSTTSAHGNYDSGFTDEFGAQYVYDIPGKVYSLFKPVFIRKYPVRDVQNPTFLRTSADARFHLQPPLGQFNYRDIYGVLHQQSFTDLQGASSLGNIIKDLDDYYVCAAKRYYQFFTGIDVPVYDFKDPSYENPSADEVKHRNIVLKLGTDLKSTQSLELLIRDIISLDIYKLQGFGTK